MKRTSATAIFLCFLLLGLQDLPTLSPDYSEAELAQLEPGNAWAARRIQRQSGPTTFPTAFDIPVVFMMGRNDLQTPYEPARTYFEDLDAPVKKMATFEYSSHFPMLEEPGRFLLYLVREVLPLATEE